MLNSSCVSVISLEQGQLLCSKTLSCLSYPISTISELGSSPNTKCGSKLHSELPWRATGCAGRAGCVLDVGLLGRAARAVLQALEGTDTKICTFSPMEQAWGGCPMLEESPSVKGWGKSVSTGFHFFFPSSFNRYTRNPCLFSHG